MSNPQSEHPAISAIQDHKAFLGQIWEDAMGENEKINYLMRMKDHEKRKQNNEDFMAMQAALAAQSKHLQNDYSRFRHNVPRFPSGSRAYDVTGKRTLVLDRTGREIKEGSLVYVDFEQGPEYGLGKDVHGYNSLKGKFFIVEEVKSSFSCPIKVVVRNEERTRPLLRADSFQQLAPVEESKSYWLTSEEVLCVDADEPQESKSGSQER